MSDDFLNLLNPEQRKAVTLPEESALILAGAGSGKTRVLTSRINFLLTEGICHPSEILAVTFTNKAAREMLDRVGRQLPIKASRMWVGTFHGLCNRMLRAQYKAAGLPQSFTILDQSDQLSMIKRVMKAHDFSTEINKPSEVQSYINGCKEEGLRATDVHEKRPRFIDKLSIYERYEDTLAKEGACDFAELLLRSYELLKNHPEIRKHYQDQFRFILIDEFQDTNKLQYKWIKLISGIEDGRAINTVFAVGDDDQSIYSFRGANLDNMRQFLHDFKVTDPIRLEQNYRSTGNILKAANELIARNPSRLGKNLWTNSGEGEKIRVFEAENDLEEARFVVEAITQYRSEGIKYKDMAVLYRSNAQSRVLESALNNNGIPYLVYGGFRFYDRQEIKNALAYLRLAENTSDDAAFLRVINVPTRGIGQTTVEKIIDEAEVKGCSCFEVARSFQGRAAKAIASFVSLIEEIRAKKDQMPLGDLVSYAVAKSGLVSMYETDPNGQDRIENLRELTSAAESFVVIEHVDEETEETELKPLALFLANATLESGESQSKLGEDAVQLMTVHSAKGLEFEIVFITGLEEGLFPHNNSIFSPESIEEERRLMYVAITRAKKRLYMTMAHRRLLNGREDFHIPSSYLSEIPAELLKYLSPQSRRSTEVDSSSERDDFGESIWNRGRRMENWTRQIFERPKPTTFGMRSRVKSNSPYAPGTKILHEKFGEGVIYNLTGEGETQLIDVMFSKYGKKQMLLSIAKNKIKIV